ncbi:MAG: HAD-IC family P-type ATPase [Saprospiraceae bacterium]|nr:HAD-IC family P-type ATPase [Candidatus Brachybacter algidus]
MKQHQHIYDEHGAQVCCTLEEKINRDAKQKITTEDNDEGCCNHHSANNVKQSSGHNDGHDHDHDHDHQHGSGIWSMFRTAIISLALLLVGLGLDHVLHPQWFSGYIRIILYIAAYLPVGLPVLRDAWVSITKGQFFSEFFLMSLATIGAFAIGEYPESVAVMLFYTIGEGFQMLAVKRAKLNIQTLLDQRPDEVSILRSGEVINIKAENAAIGDIIQLKPGEKLALDGVLISTAASFNTAALTGESVPQTKKEGDVALAGMVNLNSPIHIRVTTAYQDSKLSRILQMVQDASSRKAPTELFIRKFAKIYTPIVVVLAAMICVLPILFVEVYSFQEWLYRALVFLVISCPCALVISAAHGLKGQVDGKEILVGNFRLLDKYSIIYPDSINSLSGTVTAFSIGGRYAGYMSISDKIKKESAHADKVDKTKQIKNPQNIVAFVGDGVNDAPVMALSDVGIAMGGLGSDMTIETADVVIQDDRPDKIPMAIAIGKQTKRIVWQNITMAFVVKAAVLIIGASGLATMWEAVFADVGVALLAILNAVRIQKMRF